MRLDELASVQRWLPNHPFATDPIWQREALTISEGELQLFYARAGITRRQKAIETIGTLQAAVILSVFNGELKEPPAALILHEPPDEPFLVDELVDGLANLQPARRQACLLALELQCPPDEVADLTWHKIRERSQMSQLALEVIAAASKTRHLHLPYVFWEWATVEIATPLLELQWSIEQAFELTWPELVVRYARMVNINRHADAASLLDLARYHD